ncbi:MAG TPA: hypothetical protein VMT85_24825 [Thermoanaerobaculia bacterium]|nr:hypothetical protein [Thermoanaerobaculia bacterium]
MTIATSARAAEPEIATDPVEAIARAVLYEGYVLWPYRRSATKNRRRFTFGGVYPRGFCEEAREADRWRIRCECLVAGPATASIEVELRCLQAVHRQVLAGAGDDLRPVDELSHGGQRHLTWDEAADRRHPLPAASIERLAAAPLTAAVALPAGSADEPIAGGGEDDGREAGRFRRSWRALRGAFEIAAEPIEGDLHRVSVRLENTHTWRGADRDEAQRRSFLSTHLVLRVGVDAGFVSLTDPPPEHEAAAAGCTNDGVWPVLVGPRDQRQVLLASPIILEDHPRVAPESPGDLFDGGEIDQLLTLSILALTDEEKDEMRATDPRVREILERTERLGRDQLMRLHGTFRDPRGRW